MSGAKGVLRDMFYTVNEEDGYLKIYNTDDTEAIVGLMLKNGYAVSEIKSNKIGLEEYYIELMSKAEV